MHSHLVALVCLLLFTAELPKDDIKSEPNDLITSTGPSTISRSLIQDTKGNIWIAAFDGVFRYDGQSFANITSKVSTSRFFSVLEDSRGNLWFGSVGSGVYRYDGKAFRQFTTKDGLPNNEIGFIYEDSSGNLWFGANGGASRYDGKSFRNYVMDGDVMSEDRSGKTIPDLRPPNEVTSIVEDKAGRFWFGTRGNAFVYDGKTFAMLTDDGIPFSNVRTMIADRKGNIWLGGNGGLWRHDGSTFTHIAQNFVGHVYEDRSGNIWTSSDAGQWLLSRYDAKSLSGEKPTVTEIKSKHEGPAGMIFGILEARDGSIWFGALDGVHRYDGTTITDFNREEGKE